MWLFIVVLVLAIIFGGIGLFAKTLWWMLIIAGVLLLVGFILGLLRRGR